MIILDTNVISEMFRPRPDPCVLAWTERLVDEVAITSITLAELLAGIRRLPDGQRKTLLDTRINAAIQPYRDTRAILRFDEEAASHYADIVVAREHAGRAIHTADAQIAAICRSHDATCATRNTRDFEGIGIKLVDPWTEARSS